MPAALALVAGILAGEYAGGGTLVWCGVAAGAAAVWFLMRLCRVRAAWVLAALLVLMAAAGAARYRSEVEPAPDDVGGVAADFPHLVAIEGIVVRSVVQSTPPGEVFLPAVPYYTRCTMTVDCEQVRVGDQWRPASGRAHAVVRQPLPEDASLVPNLGDRVRISGILLPMGRPANPGGFDVTDYLRTQGVRASLRTDEWQAVKTLEPVADRLRGLVSRMQRWAVAQLDAVPTPQGRGMAAAMLFGRKDLLDFDTAQASGQDLQHAFLATGTVHYMAVSGFNVAMVVAPVLLLLRLLGAGRRVTAAVVASVVLAFVLMTELEPPVLRSAILFWVICLGWLFGRPALSLNTLAAAVITVLVVRPGDLFSASFQLSFLAVLGMMFVVGRLDRDVLNRFRRVQELRADPASGLWWRKVVRGTLMISVAATLVTAPLIAGKFHVLAWTAPLASAVLLPLVFLLTVTGMVLVSFGWIAAPLAAILAVPVDALGRLIEMVVRGLAAVPGVYFHVGSLTTGWVLAAYVVMALWVWRERLRVSGRRAACVALAVAATFAWTSGHRAPPAVRATFLAVGNGNTTLVELPNGRNVLYDAGSSQSNVRAATTVIAPALWARGIDRIDAIFISHAHFDHFKDILPVVDRFGVRQVFVPPTFMRKRLAADNAVIEALIERGVEVQFISAGDGLAGTGATEVRAVWPRGPRSQTNAINDGSLVLAVGGEGQRLMLAGDLMPASEAALMTSEPDLRTDCLLWPHHGHDPAAAGRLARTVGAKVLVVSAAPPMKPSPPPPWLAETGMTCYHTGESGAVTLLLLPDGPRVETFNSVPEVDGESSPRETSDGQDD